MTKLIKNKRILYLVILVLIIVFVGIRLKKNKEITQQKIYTYDKNQPLNVQADTIKLQQLVDDGTYSGTFEPDKETKVSADVQGKILSVLVDLGSVVRKGQPIVQLDNSLLKLQLQSIEVQMEGLEADVNRYSILAKADAIQGVQLEKAILAFKASKVQKATLLQQISKTTVRVPFSGLVTAKLSEEGAFAAPGIPLVQVTDITNLKFTINVPENNLRQFEINHSYPLSVDSYPEVSLIGKAIMIGSKANIGSSFPVQFALNNTPDLKIKSGMFGKVNLKNDTKRKVITVPISAVIESGDQAQVYRIKNGKAILQNITVSSKIQNEVVVSSGLNVDDIIVVNGFINLFNGANVTTKQNP